MCCHCLSKLTVDPLAFDDLLRFSQRLRAAKFWVALPQKSPLTIKWLNGTLPSNAAVSSVGFSLRAFLSF